MDSLIFIPTVSFVVAFLAGLFSFASPCVFPLIPSYLSYISGISVEKLIEGKSRQAKKAAIRHSLLFILGFTLIFVLLGLFSGTIGFVLKSIWFMRISGILIAFMGLYIIGVFNNLKFLSFLSGDKQFSLSNKPSGYIGSIIVGIIFAAAWTPCIGPILASILFIGATMHNTIMGGELLFVYSIGLAIPFFISAISVNLFLTMFKKLKKYIKIIQVLSGILLIIVGVLIFFNYLSIISLYFGNTFHYNLPYNG